MQPKKPVFPINIGNVAKCYKSTLHFILAVPYSVKVTNYKMEKKETIFPVVFNCINYLSLKAPVSFFFVFEFKIIYTSSFLIDFIF